MSSSSEHNQIQQSALSYVQVWGNLTVGNITQSVNQSNVPLPTEIPQNLPYSGTVEFAGRFGELETLHRKLQGRERVVIYAIAGMGGVGKTELAIQYALAHQEAYQGGICWLQAREQDIGFQIVNFAKTYLNLNPSDDLDLPNQVRWCWQRWREGDVLIILDDVNNYTQVKPYLPPSASRFKLLLTTRKRLLKSSQRLELDVLKPKAAIALLKLLIGRERLQQEPWIGKTLCKWLGYLPLGLELVGRYLERKPDLSLQEMLQRLQEKRLEQSSLQKPQEDMTAQLGVAAAFDLSWQELSPAAQEIGCLLSLLALAPFPWELVEQSALEHNSEKLEEIRDDTLLNLHLLQRIGAKTYRLHELIRQFLQKKLLGLAQAERLKNSVCQTAVKLAEQFPDIITQQQVQALSIFVPHIAEVATSLTTYFDDEKLNLTFSKIGKFYEGQGLYQQAEPWYNKSLSAVQKHLGEEHLNIARSLNNLAWLYWLQSRYSEAEPLYLQALVLQRRFLGEEHPDIARNMNNLAMLYRSQGRYSEAEVLYTQALEMGKKLWKDEEHPDVAFCLHNLAALYRNIGRFYEAETLHLQALELQRRLLGEEHSDVARSLNNLALLYFNQERYWEAEPLYLQVLAIWKHLLGEEHPNVALCLHNIALVYQKQKDYHKAEITHLKALKIRQTVLGNNHYDVALSLNSLASLYEEKRYYSKAEIMYKKALTIWKLILGKNHPNVAIVLGNLAQVYYLQGRYFEAENMHQKALQLRQMLGIRPKFSVCGRPSV
ncbi:tetratricopeptide repeat protein [Planktothrix sp. FACHB-1355]|uniref:Tetratricopeptide repeat protein n=1 Tax=Aerosakkonema funiforme FACHB-1375 TaxID=2949571 RepID=A0A926VAP9_9CYAN|nr:MULTISPECIES: tetratricopeptide repeat protein [Oscillatoriales]MBD2180311.1 tetratricopeptide repeat protein [Aerosakkonema funiforme FACHB-1375]MBD3557406.1 tetratricopeptide repeat protein [Planktothrix sp. FACHB-1355]